MQSRVLWEDILNRLEHVEVLDEPEQVGFNLVMEYSHGPVLLHPQQTA